MMMSVKDKFSKNLFWDVDVSRLDVDANRRYVIGRVLDRGTDNDLRLAFSYYTFPVVVEVAKSLRTLERRALSFISAISGESKDKFRCYTWRQSSPIPWLY